MLILIGFWVFRKIKKYNQSMTWSYKKPGHQSLEEWMLIYLLSIL